MQRRRATFRSLYATGESVIKTAGLCGISHEPDCLFCLNESPVSNPRGIIALTFVRSFQQVSESRRSKFEAYSGTRSDYWSGLLSLAGSFCSKPWDSLRKRMPRV